MPKEIEISVAIPIAIRSPSSGHLRLVTSRHVSDSDLAAAISERDETALEAIYRQHGGAVKTVARRVLNDDALADDVVQDVFVTLWRAPERYDASRGSLRTFLLTVAHRRAVDVVRSEVARSQREEKSPPPETVVDLDSEIWQRTQSALVRQAVAALGDDERKAISLAYFGGLSYIEVARKLGEPEGTVKSRIRSGMRKLADVLGEVAS